MKIQAGAADRFVREPDPRINAVLIYGPDNGLVRERARILAQTAVDDLNDPFMVSEVTVAALRDDPSRLSDEAASMSLMGGRRLVRLRDATDGITDQVRAMLEAGNIEALVVVEAGDLAARSRLRKLFEESPAAAALACYADDQRALEGVIRETLGQYGLKVSDDAMIFLLDNLGGDRMISRMELEKLAAYAEGAGLVSLEDASACVGDSAVIVLDDIAFSAASGQQTRLARALAHAFDEGNDPIRVLRVVTRHFLRLHLAAGVVAGGESPDRATKMLRPPVFFKRQDEFRSQLRRWSPVALSQAIESLTGAEIACKSTGIPGEAACGRALMRLAARAAS